jgi:PAS domain S-box-containing protein
MKPANIVLVEDNEAHAELILRAFEQDAPNDNIRHCKNLKEARIAIDDEYPDLLIADLNLPDGKGLELVAQSKSDKSYPLILMTSYGDENVAVNAMKSGAFDYIVKSPEAFDSMPKVVDRSLREWRNIADKQHAQQALLLHETEQSEILGTIVDSVITINESGKILTFNKAAELMFGYSSVEIIGKNIKKLMPNSVAEEHDNYIQTYLTTGKSNIIGDTREVEGQRKNKKIFPMRISIAELPKNNLGQRRFIGSCQDLTFIKNQEEQLRRSQKMDALGKLTGGIAHDYNNILGIILGYAEQLTEHLTEDTKLSKYALNIQHAAERGSKLTKKLLSFSKNKTHDATIVNINAILHEQSLMVEKTIMSRIKLDYKLDENLWSVKLDIGDLEDAIVNMSINAMHAMPSGGILTFRTSNEQLSVVEATKINLTPGDYVLLSITDTGYGMDSITKEKIFDPFFTTKGEQGTGLGLSQVYGFIERSNGWIKAYSELGHGSRFALYFPRCYQSTTEKSKFIQKEMQNLHGNETILIVDDEQAMLELAQEILIAKGYQVRLANNGIQALSILEKEAIDLVVSDVIMPEMDGYQLAANIQELYPDLKIQMVTGFADDRNKNNFNLNLNKILYKPYTSKKLLEKIRNLLDQNNKTKNSNLSGYTIMVMDDEDSMLELFKINLNKLGCDFILASNPLEAISLFNESLNNGKQIDVIILDLSIPGSIGGKELAEELLNIDPKIKMIVSSGHTEALEMTDYKKYGFKAALEKNHNRKILRKTLEQVLELN